MKTYKTALGTRVTTRGNHITLETPKADVVPMTRARKRAARGKNRNLEWLMRDVCSTPYATIVD